MTAVQWVSFFTVLYSLYLVTRYVIEFPEKWRITVPMLTWLIHSVIFYIALIIAFDAPSALGTLWSSILRWHGYIAVALMLQNSIYYARMKVKKNVRANITIPTSSSSTDTDRPD